MVVPLSMVSFRFLINTEPGDTRQYKFGREYIVHISYPLSEVDYISTKYSHIFAATLFSLPVLKVKDTVVKMSSVSNEHFNMLAFEVCKRNSTPV